MHNNLLATICKAEEGKLFYMIDESGQIDIIGDTIYLSPLHSIDNYPQATLEELEELRELQELQDIQE